MKAQLRDCKPAVMRLLEDGEDDLAANVTVLETREDLVAVRIRSRSLGREVWLARDVETARELHAEMPRAHRLPVLLFDELGARTREDRAAPEHGAVLLRR